MVCASNYVTHNISIIYSQALHAGLRLNGAYSLTISGSDAIHFFSLLAIKPLKYQLEKSQL